MGSKKDLILGTALWGWSIDKPAAFALLDSYYKEGFRWLDTATNYPIDRNPEHHRLAEKMLAQWAQDRKVFDLSLIVKVGSLSNDGSPVNDLTPEFIRHAHGKYRTLFGTNLDGLWIHWDNRDSLENISATLSALREVSPSQPVGLSGIRYPELYAKAGRDLDLRFRIQIKHNLLSSALAHYKGLRERSTFYAYGLNAGGLSLTPSSSESSSMRLRHIDPAVLSRLRPRIEAFIQESREAGSSRQWSTLNQIAMLYAYGSPELSGMIIGPSKLEQLAESISCFRQLESRDIESCYRKLAEMIQVV
jgi:aryl-alcohol dehydrogenase-like predicted oxidoreductase